MAQSALKLPPSLDAFVEEQVRSGAYPDRDAVIVEAVDMLRVQIAADEISDEEKLTRLKAKIQEGVDSLDRGEGIRVNDISAYVDGVMDRVRKRLA
jgi:putative addiction module CopG family antidote